MRLLMFQELNNYDHRAPFGAVPVHEFVLDEPRKERLDIKIAVGEYFGLDAIRPVLQSAGPVSETPEALEEDRAKRVCFAEQLVLE